MRVAIAINRMADTGLTTYPVELSRVLESHGHSVEILTRKDSRPEQRYISRVLPRVCGRREAAWLTGAVRGQGFDVLHATSPELLLADPDVPTVWTAWHTPHDLVSRWAEAPGSGYVRPRDVAWHLSQSWKAYRLDSYAAGRCDAIIAPTRRLAEDLSGAGYRPVFVPPPISLPPEGARKLLPEIPSIVFPSANPNARRKGFDLLQAALEALRPRLRFRVDHLYRFSKGVAGMEEARAALHEATILAMPSRREEFGYVALEALSVGTPVVAFDVPALDEIVDASCGRLVPPFDTAAFADAMEGILTDPALYASLSQGARRRARAFGGDALLPRLEAVYRSVL